MKIRISALKRLIREALTEVDTDPSNNPGRPQDAYEYLGMRPKPTDAMAHPSLGGGAAGGGGVASSSASGGSIDAEFDAASADVDSAEGEEKAVKESRRRRYR